MRCLSHTEDGQCVVLGLPELGKTSVPPSGSGNASTPSDCEHQGCSCDPPRTVDQHPTVNPPSLTMNSFDPESEGDSPKHESEPRFGHKSLQLLVRLFPMVDTS